MADNQSGQYLTFCLNKDLYAFNLLKIREVLELTKITKVPRTPKFMSGVINLRGKVVPVVDLRVKFELEEVEQTIDTSIIIVEVSYDNDVIILGALVDSVKSVIKLEDNMHEPPPKVGLNIDLSFIDSIGKVKEDFVIILNIDKIFSAKELSFILDKATNDEQVTDNKE
ncbi:MAG TPA: chemotaxis protein CheW [Spirochaetota bacterium]|nr:chemotaxis protein CheW [Spirochaetota bacterium]